MQQQSLVRKMIPADTPALLALWQRVFPDNPPHNAPHLVLAAKLKVDDLVFVYAANNAAISGACMAGYDGHRGWLYAVAVAPECRRMGIGKQLAECAINELRIRGCKKVNLQIRAGNAEVSAFYAALGFAVEQRLSMGKHI